MQASNMLIKATAAMMITKMIRMKIIRSKISHRGSTRSIRTNISKNQIIMASSNPYLVRRTKVEVPER